jgi:coenzyme F420-reducing hydrogenase delta subunit/heterodisulfide reductase subunit C
MLGPRELNVVGSEQIDFSFADEITGRPGGEHLYTCSSCGTCTATCLVRRVDAAFNPRLMILKATLGFREQVLSSPEIWECSSCDACYPRCPKKIRLSGVFRAIREVAIAQGHERPGVPARVDVATCVACGRCVEACPYRAISLQDVSWGRQTKPAAQVDKNLCLECGICSAVCPSSAISASGYGDLDVHTSLVDKADGLQRATAPGSRTSALVLVCNWCLHANVDVRLLLDPPPDVQLVSLPCAGRVSPLFLLTALQHGTHGILVVGCSKGECHYIRGSEIEARRFEVVGDLFEMLGITRQRLRYVRLGALDRGRFAGIVEAFAREMQDIRPLPMFAQERSA